MPASRRLLPPFGLALALLGSASPARAQGEEAPLRLSWQSPLECPSEREVRDEIARLAPPGRARPALDARALVHQEASGRWVGAFRVEQGEFVGERLIEADTCAEVAHAFALVVALALDPNASLEPPAPAAPTPGPLATVAPPLAPAGPLSDGAPAARAKARRPLAWVAGAGLRLQTGLLPGLASGVGLDVGATWGANGVYANGVFFPEREQTLSGISEAKGRYGLWGAGLSGCHSWPLGGLEVEVCARTRWGSAWARSKGVSRESSGRGLWGSGGGVGALRVPLGPRGALRAELEAGASTKRPRFVIEGAEAGYEWPLLYAGASLGGELHF
ncbi:MAG TPA: hypothetical protein VFS43_07745 [Polyangiaceae bacterium]|nr:hypothetical protein [Polyangiaceae bacterium]